MEISKELLSEVLFGGRVQIKGFGINGAMLDYSLYCSINEKDGTEFNKDIPDNYYVKKSNIYEYINIYELIYSKLKQWSKLNNVFNNIDWSEEPEQILSKVEEIRNQINEKQLQH